MQHVTTSGQLCAHGQRNTGPVSVSSREKPGQWALGAELAQPLPSFPQSRPEVAQGVVREGSPQASGADRSLWVAVDQL